jgi:hypothetical protein
MRSSWSPTPSPGQGGQPEPSQPQPPPPAEVGWPMGRTGEGQAGTVSAARQSAHVDRDREPVVLVTRLADSRSTCASSSWTTSRVRHEVLEAIYRGPERRGPRYCSCAAGGGRFATRRSSRPKRRHEEVVVSAGVRDAQKSVFDPQGRTIQDASACATRASDVRQEFFELSPRGSPRTRRAAVDESPESSRSGDQATGRRWRMKIGSSCSPARTATTTPTTS